MVRSLPLVILIPESDPKLSESLIAQGCSAVLTKPLDVSLLYEVLGRLSWKRRQTHRIPVRMRVKIEEASPATELTCVTRLNRDFDLVRIGNIATHTY